MEVLHPHERAALAERLVNDIDAAILETHKRGHSWRLGPSALEDDCDRKIWYGFRWVKLDERSARMHRLLDHGKETEPRFDAWLLGAGCTVYEIDPSAPETRKNRQYRVRACGDHVGGFLDGIVYLPPHYNYPYPLVLEKKSSNTKGFVELHKEGGGGVKVKKPAHAHQAGYYGWKYGMRYSLYVSLNKNDDDMHLEIIENDYVAADMDERRFWSIITADRPPARISEKSTDYRCNMCRHHAICHNGADYEKNCRSCEHGQPVDGGEWRCNLRSQTIPREIAPVGCEHYHPVGR
jgi:hypothetical protein